MKVAAPSLLPLLRSQAQGEILAWVFLTPGEHSIADIARATGVPEATVLREIDRLSATGFVAERRQGRSRPIASDPDKQVGGRRQASDQAGREESNVDFSEIKVVCSKEVCSREVHPIRRERRKSHVDESG